MITVVLLESNQEYQGLDFLKQVFNGYTPQTIHYIAGQTSVIAGSQ